MTKKPTPNIHSGHRRRMRQNFLKHGAEHLEPHQILEIFLFGVLPRGDTNPLAHRLINAFGTIRNIVDADVKHLMAVEGVGESVAAQIKLIPEMLKQYTLPLETDKEPILDQHVAKTYLSPHFFGAVVEKTYMLILDGLCHVKECVKLSEGHVSAAYMDIRSLVAIALEHNACSVILAHNHPSGLSIPSRDDIETTKQIAEALRMVDIPLLDHLVFGREGETSMCSSGML